MIVHNQPPRYAKTRRATLVIVPKSLVFQWKRELERWVDEGVLNVFGTFS